jgi:hypothetical protein
MRRSRTTWLRWLDKLDLTQEQIGPLFGHGARTAQRWASDAENVPKAVWILTAAMAELEVDKPEAVLAWIKAQKRTP